VIWFMAKSFLDRRKSDFLGRSPSMLLRAAVLSPIMT
jgi:hypothetical protein